MTLLDVIQARDAILHRIKAAKIGIGSNKPNSYLPSEHPKFRTAHRRRAEWALKLEYAKQELKDFDAHLAKVEVGNWELE